MKFVLVHGAATDSSVWDDIARLLRSSGADVAVPDRPQTGDMDREIEFLAPLCEEAVVIGVSGGATLGLELASRGVRVRAAWLHEPAAGALAPGLLSHVAEGLERDGVRGFGEALYGPSWQPSFTQKGEETIRAEFGMFGRFEPAPLRVPADRVVLTTGGRSTPKRTASVRALADFLGVRVITFPGVGHAAHLEHAYTEETLNTLRRETLGREERTGDRFGLGRECERLG